MATNSINPADCQVFIQIWVDVNPLQPQQTTGIYMVDNQASAGSSNEGTPSLNTIVAPGNNVCWTILPIDPQYAGMFSISSVTAVSGWEHPPAMYNENAAIYTGQLNMATVAGNLVQGVAVNYNNGAMSWSNNLPATVQFLTNDR